MSELRDRVPPLFIRQSDLNIEALVFFAGGQGPGYAPDRSGNDEYVDAHDSDYDFG
ncbi:hypothetical protein PM076_13610 [Halorubrum ezzemoulense]|uniref:Uncharacterized protein n=1 Tax=Halorubrum ezzemoulense TaxID=337243 RepID=A0ABT4Z4B6_HALEZ|nr:MULTISPECIES: hypothetical protein [Halorubrum]MDB2226214.1 hypothetical protein [Halorubrum ezzemoulense]MDB2239096.1 hypothetical protein [Halorubrum ezzemoulense]MDB2242896.1 hypothetical protein [Halorubrum ezzemoulense]MDB2245725.1 hypothetical protein [Halorubrum ezzemoulense]MDB2248627.1 hypothetical protein [Halorubrum ezzemoulense]